MKTTLRTYYSTAWLGCFFFLLCLHSASVAQTISTFAGGGQGSSNKPATSAKFYYSTGMAVDRAGNYYFADLYDNVLYKVRSADGLIQRIAGTGAGGFDSGPAISVRLQNPTDVAVDSIGNVYVLEHPTYTTIRKISAADSTSSPITSAEHVSGFAVDAAGNVYFANGLTNLIQKLNSRDGSITTIAGNGQQGYSGDGGPATAASLSNVTGLAIDRKGAIYIACGSIVRKISDTDGIITTLAGNGTSGFSGDGGPAINASFSQASRLAVDAAGNLYVSDGFRIRRISAADKTVRTIAGTGDSGYSGDGGPAINATLGGIMGLGVDNPGNVYINSSGVIRKITAASGLIHTVAGKGSVGPTGDGGTATDAILNSPSKVAVDRKGNVFISAQNEMRKISASKEVSTLANNYQHPASYKIYRGLSHLAVDTAENIYFIDYIFYNRMSPNHEVTQLGSIFTRDGYPPSMFYPSNAPSGITVDKAGTYYVSDLHNNRVLSPTGVVAGNGTNGFSGDGGPATQASVGNPGPLAIDKAGNLYIATSGRIRKVSAGSGIISTVAGGGTEEGEGIPATTASLYVEALAVDEAGNLFISEGFKHRVRMVNIQDGTIRTVAGTGTAGFSGDGGPAAKATLNNPTGIAVDKLGNLYIADKENNRIRQVRCETTTFYADADGDGYGDASKTSQGCGYASPKGYVTRAGDCDDTNAGIHPAAAEVCDGKDNDCNGQIDEGLTPLITTAPPSSSTACPGSTVTVSLAAGGSNLHYQWSLNGKLIKDATTSTLTLTGVKASDAGTYTCSVSGGCTGQSSQVTSSAFVLSIGTPTSINKQLSDNLATCPGGSVSLSVKASGTNLSYQWYKGSVGEPNKVKGQTTAMLSLSNVQQAQAGSYVCVVSGTCGSVTSSPVTLSVKAPAAITKQPLASSTATPGSTVSARVEATGTNLRFQWFRNGSRLAGQTAATLQLKNVKAGDGGNYQCEVTGDCGSVLSSTFVLTIGSLGGRLSVDNDESRTALQVEVYPVPVVNEEVWVTIYGQAFQSAELEVIDTRGRVIATQTIQLLSSRHTHRLDIAAVPKGALLLKVSTSQERVIKRLLN